jgi:hypothetical protein
VIVETGRRGFAPLQKQRFQVWDDAREGGPEQAQICCNLSGSSWFDNVGYGTSKLYQSRKNG